MNENLNLVEILKDCPKGTKLYSTVYGDVEFACVKEGADYPIVVWCTDRRFVTILPNGCYIKNYNGECILFPSKDQRDWSKWKCPKSDLPIDTPVMVESYGWCLGFYAGNGRVFVNGNSHTSKLALGVSCIIPFDKFNPNDIEGSLKYNIVGNGE